MCEIRNNTKAAGKGNLIGSGQTNYMLFPITIYIIYYYIPDWSVQRAEYFLIALNNTFAKFGV